MKLVATLTTMLLIAGSVSVYADTDTPNIVPLGATVVAVNAIFITFNGIYSYTDPPQRGPILMGVVFGFGSSLLGGALVMGADPEQDTQIFGFGLSMLTSGVASMTFALINSNRYSKHMRQSAVKPELSFDLRGSRGLRLGLRMEF